MHTYKCVTHLLVSTSLISAHTYFNTSGEIELETVMTLNLPEPLARYFDAANAMDVDALVATFAPDGIVHDQSKEMHGRDAIRAWREHANKSDRAEAEPKSVEQHEDETKVVATLSGSFPGSRWT